MQLPPRCALLVIDMQLALVTGAYREQAVLAALAALAEVIYRANLAHPDHQITVLDSTELVV